MPNLHSGWHQKETVFFPVEGRSTNVVSTKLATGFSLEYFLAKFSLYDKKRWLAQEKALLAVILAHSLLQLHGSPWMTHHLSASQVIIHYEPGLSFDECTRFELRQPYLSSGIGSSSHRPELIGQPSAGKEPTTVSSLIELGVILLELHFASRLDTTGNLSIENLQIEAIKKHLKCGNDVDMKKPYWDAIAECIHLYAAFQRGELTFENPDFRVRYYERVIMQLENNVIEHFESDERLLNQL